MTGENNDSLIDKFPISGQAVCGVLMRTLRSEDVCVIADIETLCSRDCTELGDLWRRVVASRAERVTVREMLTALESADQVISLDARYELQPERRLLIDDGMLIENKL